MYCIVYTKNAIKDIKKLKSLNLYKQAKVLIELIKETPYRNIPSYEKLLGELNGAYSRRINIQHRLVYEVIEEENTIKIISMCTHHDV